MAVLNLLPAFAWAGFIFAVSSIPGNNIPGFFPFQDILFHISEYAILAWLVRRAIKAYYPLRSRWYYIYWTVAICLIYGIGDEFHQSFVPYRDASLLDVSFDTIGAIIANLFVIKPIREHG